MRVSEGLRNNLSGGAHFTEFMRRLIHLEEDKVYAVHEVMGDWHSKLTNGYRYSMAKACSDLGIIKSVGEVHRFVIIPEGIKWAVKMRMWQPNGGFVCSVCGYAFEGKDRCSHKGHRKTCKTCFEYKEAMNRQNMMQAFSDTYTRKNAVRKYSEAQAFAGLADENIPDDQLISGGIRLSLTT